MKCSCWVVIAFLAGLHFSDLWSGPVLIVCPVTVMQQWVQELHTWWPPFRATLFHQSGSFEGTKEQMIEEVSQSSEPRILLTSYEGVRLNLDLLLTCNWSYMILDEGQKTQKYFGYYYFFFETSKKRT